MVRRGHEIGSHSVWHKHPEIPSVRPAHDRGYDAKYEAEESKRLISGWVDMEIPSFCYPFCKKDGWPIQAWFWLEWGSSTARDKYGDRQMRGRQIRGQTERSPVLRRLADGSEVLLGRE